MSRVSGTMPMMSTAIMLGSTGGSGMWKIWVPTPPSTREPSREPSSSMVMPLKPSRSGVVIVLVTSWITLPSFSLMLM